MLYAILCHDNETVVEGWTKEQDAAVIAKRRRVQARLAAPGRLGAVARLMPTTAAITIRAGREPLVIDGPFAETKERGDRLGQALAAAGWRRRCGNRAPTVVRGGGFWPGKQPEELGAMAFSPSRRRRA